MILSAKKIDNKWVVYNELSEVIAKAKIQEKKAGVYGKIIYHNTFEQEILFNIFACKNGRLKINIFENEKYKTALYRDVKIGENKLPYLCYNLKYDNYSYHGYHIKSAKEHSDLYIYCQNELAAVFSIRKQNDMVYVDMFAEDHLDIKMLIAYLITHQIFIKRKRAFVSEFAPHLLHSSDSMFVGRIKEHFLKESDL